MAATLQANTPLAEQLSSIVQPKLVDIGWSSGSGDDAALAEYIILMLVNGKTQDQIASELSNDLLNLGPEDSGARDFASWLFEQVELLTTAAKGGAPEPAQAPTAAQTIPSLAAQEPDPLNTLSSDADAEDAEMGDVIESSAEASM